MSNPSEAVKRAIKLAGGGAELARALGLQRQAVYQWDKIPPHHVLRVEELSGVPRHELRPDMYPAPQTEAAQ